MTAKKPPLILHVIHHLVIGGMENGLINLINRLPVSRFQHAIICIDHSSNFSLRIKRQDVQIIALNRPKRGIWAVRKDIFLFCKKYQPAIVHSRNLSGLDALLPARLAGVRYCIHGEHGRDTNDLKGNNKKLKLLRWLHKPLINHYITVSKDLQQYLINEVNVNPKKITQIYNGVDTNKFYSDSNISREILPSTFIGKNKIIIGTVGRLQPVKNHLMLLQAYSGFLTYYPTLAKNTYLAIIGDGPLLNELKKVAESLNISDRVWFPGSMDTVADTLKTFDLFVLPSLAEGISNTILEAMATNLPIIATNVGGNTELVKEGINGRFFSPKDIDGLINIFVEYTSDTGMMKNHGLAARQSVIDNFSLATMISNYEKIYENNIYYKSSFSN